MGFLSAHETTDLFNTWVEDHLRNETFGDLMRYRWTHPDYKGNDSNDFQLPEGYFSFLEDYDVENDGFFSIARWDFLEEYSLYVSQPPKEKLEEVRNDRNRSIPFQLIGSKTSGQGIH